MPSKTLSADMIEVSMSRTTDTGAHFWDKEAAKYAKSKIGDIAGYKRSLLRTQDYLNKSDKVLELGCGTGTTALEHAPHVSHITGTDYSVEMIKIANQKAFDAHQLNAEFVVADAARLPFANGTFDVVMAHNLLHLVNNIEASLEQAHRVLKTNGIFIVKTPCLGDMNILMRKVVLPVMLRVYGVSTLQIFKEESHKQTIQNAGFKIECTENHNTRGRDNRPFIVARKV